MVIKIPSASIYDIRNEKIRDNVIDRLEVRATSINPNNNFNVKIFTDTVGTEQFSTYPKEEDDKFETYTTNAGLTTNYYSYGSVQPIYLTAYNINIFAKIKNAFISQLYDKLDAKGSPNIKWVVYYTRNVYSIVSHSPLEWQLVETNEMAGTIPENALSVNTSPTGAITPNVNIALTDETNAGKLTFTYDVASDRFWLNGLKILVGSTTEQYSYTQKEWLNQTSYSSDSAKYEYIPHRIEITIYGETVGIDLTDIESVFQNGYGENPYSIDGSELLQTNIGLDTNYQNLLVEYGDGKETAELLCSIGEYYDYDNGALVISTKDTSLPMLFRHYDEVIPMVWGANGADKPMSAHKDGSAKVFKVLGVTPIFDGASWQKIYLQEI